MEAFVITVKHSELSNKAADNCINSIRRFHPEINPEKFFGFTPKDKPQEMLERYQYPTHKFIDKYSRHENAMAAFLSHHKLWKYSMKSNKSIFIFEHDAQLVSPLPITKWYDEKKDKPSYKIMPTMGNIVNLGHPSYGNWYTPPNIGVNNLTSKQYFPGAHAYFIRPQGARDLVNKSKEDARPTDVFINLNNFKYLQEYFPFCAVARDNFSTIQRLDGVTAKHGFKKGYKLVKI